MAGSAPDHTRIASKLILWTDLTTAMALLFAATLCLQSAVVPFNGARSSLHVAIDCLFPPFKTTIDDPLYPDKKTIVGQWYD